MQSKNKFYVKVHSLRENKVVAICDEEILGKKFENEDCNIEIKDSFYKGELKGEKEVMHILKIAPNINLVGERTIGLAINLGIINEEDTIKIGNTKHAQTFQL